MSKVTLKSVFAIRELLDTIAADRAELKKLKQQLTTIGGEWDYECGTFYECDDSQIRQRIEQTEQDIRETSTQIFNMLAKFGVDPSHHCRNKNKKKMFL